MKIVFSLVFMFFFTGCAQLVEIMIETGTQGSAYDYAKRNKMNHPTLSKVIESIDEISIILTVSMPPDFEKTRKMIKTKNKGHTQMALITAINWVEKSSNPYLKGKEQNMEKAREIIAAGLRGSKRGFKTYQLEINPIQTSSANE